jgi:hypothetical protein
MGSSMDQDHIKATDPRGPPYLSAQITPALITIQRRYDNGVCLNICFTKLHHSVHVQFMQI